MIGEGKIQKIQIKGITGRSSSGGLETFQLVVQSCDVSRRANLIKHPVESNQQVFDNKVLEPRVITIRAYVSAKDQDTVRKLESIWSNRKFEFYTITTRADTYKNFCCEECSHSEGTEKLDALDYTIRFCEVLKARGRTQPADVDDSSTQNYGSTGS